MSKLNLTQTFKAQIGSGEKREITFLANSGKPMANGETIDLDTLQTRDPETGANVLVKDLNASDSKNYLPLLVDHEWSVDKKAGEVRGLWLDDAGLMARATLANNDNGNNVLALAKDDMLDTFSVTVEFADGDQDKDGVIHNGRLLEISAVWLGNDETTKLVSVNERKDAEMANISMNELTADEAKSLNDAIDELKAKVQALTEGGDGDGEGDAPATSNGGDDTTPAEPAKNESKSVNNFVNIQMNERKAEKESKTKVNQIEVKSNSKSYIDSNDAVRDFARIIKESRGEEAARTSWNSKLRSYALDADILPTSIEQIFFKTWTDQDSILSTFRTTGKRSMDIYALAPVSDEGGRAKGHKPGEVKQDQELKTFTRMTRVKGIYKKLPLDLQDLVDDDSGELVAFRAQELADRVANEIVVSALIGDGRTEGTPDLRTFDGTKGLWSMKADIDGSTTKDTYASAVATKVTEVAGDSLYASYFKTLSAVHTNGRKVLVVPYGAIAELLTSKDTTNKPIFAPGTTPEQIFPNTRVFELEEMVGNEMQAIAYADGSAYVLNGDSAGRVFTDFDITKNQDVMEVVRYVGGSLQGRKLAAGLVKAGA